MFIGWWLQAVFYSPAPYRSLGIKLESQITAAGLCVPLQKLYGKGNNIVLCYPSTLPCLSPKDLREWVSCSSSRVVQRPPRKLQLLGSAGSQSGNSRAGSRCSVSLPWASLVMHFLVWIFCLSLYFFFFKFGLAGNAQRLQYVLGLAFFRDSVLCIHVVPCLYGLL